MRLYAQVPINRHPREQMLPSFNASGEYKIIKGAHRILPRVRIPSHWYLIKALYHASLYSKQHFDSISCKPLEPLIIYYIMSTC